MNQLGFIFRKTAGEHCGDHEIRVQVDGKDLLDDVDDEMLGLDPPDFFELAKTQNEGELIVGRCSCGVLECGSASVSVIRAGEEVAWQVPDRYGAPKYTLVFNSTDYDRAFELAAQDKGWETIERTAERLISQLDFAVAKRYGLTFKSAYARDGDNTVRLYFVKAPENSLSFVAVPWNHESPLDALAMIESMLKEWLIKGEPHGLSCKF
jgi:hypothetical protein